VPAAYTGDVPVLVDVRVIPRAKRTELAGRRGASLLVRLAAPPVEGAANEALVAWLAERLGVARRQVTIARGSASRDKVIAIEGLALADVTARLGVDLPAG
jgi:uncharacterized protein (TIGR00251 family)